MDVAMLEVEIEGDDGDDEYLFNLDEQSFLAAHKSVPSLKIECFVMPMLEPGVLGMNTVDAHKETFKRLLLLGYFQ